MTTPNRKFPEPQGWALNWDAGDQDQMPTREEAQSTEDQERQQGNGEKFPQPRGWALKWANFTLSDTKE